MLQNRASQPLVWGPFQKNPVMSRYCFHSKITLISCIVFSSSAQLLCKGQTFLTKGDVMKFPKLADTLEAVAKNGTDVFYTGEIGHDLIKDVQAAGV